MKRVYFLLILLFCLNSVYLVNALYDDGVFIYDRNRDYEDLALILEDNEKEFSDNNLSIDFSYDDQGCAQELYMIKVARDKGKVVGALFYNIKSVETSYPWEILLLIVDKVYRNQGYGSLMVESVIGDMIALEKDAVLVKISSMNKSAYHLFRNKCNFLELKWASNPFRTNEYIEFLRPNYVFVEDWSGRELDGQAITNQKLHDACKNFDCQKAKEAISEGANFYLRINFNEDEDGYCWDSRSPLYFAIEQNNIEFTRALIEACVDINGGYEKVSPLVFAMHLDCVDSDMILLLIQAGCDVNALDRWNDNSLLYRAFVLNDLAIAKALIDAGADIYYVDNYSLLDDAILKDDLAFLRLLLEAGYDVNHQDDEGDTALDKAIYYVCDDAVIYTLLHAGADVYQVNAEGDTPLSLIDCMLDQYALNSIDNYRLRAEIAQLKKIKEILLSWQN